MSEMVERVARALAAAENASQLDVGFAAPHDFPDDNLEYDWESYAKDARAAIEAMREPTHHMQDRGETALIYAKDIAFDMAHKNDYPTATWAAAVYCWQEQITAALEEGAKDD